MTEQLETIEAIPAVYRGKSGRVAQCRSRLEFRWLAWLDALGIPWDYEPAAFSIEDKAYLPDLFLPREQVWVELKPAGWEPDHMRYGAFVRVTMEPLLLVAGPPKWGGYRITLYRPDVPREDGMVFGTGRRDPSELWLLSLTSGIAAPLSERSSRLNWPTHSSHALKEASRQAMGWRFGDAQDE